MLALAEAGADPPECSVVCFDQIGLVVRVRIVVLELDSIGLETSCFDCGSANLRLLRSLLCGEPLVRYLLSASLNFASWPRLVDNV